MSHLILAADIGGSHISSTVIDATKWQVADDKILQSHIDGFVDQETILTTWCNNLAQNVRDKEVEKIAIAMPGPFDYEKGIFEQHPEGKFGSLVGTNFKVAIQERLGRVVEIHFENDAAAFGIGESYFGQSKNVQRSIAITLGTGLGATFISNHQAIKTGASVPEGGELYHQNFKDSIADDYFSTRWFVKRAKNKYALEVKGVKELLENGDAEITKAIFQTFARSLHEFLLPYAQNFQAEAIVIGGNIAKAWSHFGATLNTLFKSNGIQVAPSVLQEKAILLGAAKSAYNKLSQ
ncbi:MAG: ROK family protein [Bacteroidota bacterium]